MFFKITHNGLYKARNFTDLNNKIMNEEQKMTKKVVTSNEAQLSSLNIANVTCRFYIKFRKNSSTTNDNGRWWIAMDWAWCKKRGSIIVLQSKIGNGDTGDRTCL